MAPRSVARDGCLYRSSRLSASSGSCRPHPARLVLLVELVPRESVRFAPSTALGQNPRGFEEPCDFGGAIGRRRGRRLIDQYGVDSSADELISGNAERLRPLPQRFVPLFIDDEMLRPHARDPSDRGTGDRGGRRGHRARFRATRPPRPSGTRASAPLRGGGATLRSRLQ